MSQFKITIGNWGESIAAAYYREQGCHLVARNWRCRHGEIDIVCVRGPLLYFVEVKTRRTMIFGNPEESITPAKWQRMLLCAESFLEEKEMYSNGYTAVFNICAIYTDYHAVDIRIFTNN